MKNKRAEYDRKYEASAKGMIVQKKRLAKYFASDKCKLTWARYRAKPEILLKDSVRRKSRYSVKKNLIIKLPCQVCGDIKSEMHHPNYSNPLKVIWLCSKHHKELHKKLNSLKLKKGR